MEKGERYTRLGLHWRRGYA